MTHHVRDGSTKINDQSESRVCRNNRRLQLRLENNVVTKAFSMKPTYYYNILARTSSTWVGKPPKHRSQVYIARCLYVPLNGLRRNFQEHLGFSAHPGWKDILLTDPEQGFRKFRAQTQRFRTEGLLGGSWVVISGAINPLIWVSSTATLLRTPHITKHELPSRAGQSHKGICIFHIGRRARSPQNADSSMFPKDPCAQTV